MGRKVKKALKRALFFGAPFLLITIGAVLLCVGFLDWFVTGNVYFRLATLSPEISGDKGPSVDYYVPYTPEEESRIEQNNKEAFHYEEDVPIITIGQKWAKISLDKIDMEPQTVYHGDTYDLLTRGIGHYANSRFPGQHGKVVIDGHVGARRLFRYLETMEVGDTVTLDTVYGKYIYRVTATYITDDKTDELRNLILPDAEDTGDRLICYACYPYNTTKVRRQKFVIDCELIQGYDYVVGKEVTPE